MPEKAPQCLVYLLDLYFSKLPKYAFEKEVFYCRPKDKTPPDDSPWCDQVPVGKISMSIVKDMCIEAKITPKSNHSLGATGASALFRSGVPETIIQKTTGHRSLKALHQYERDSTVQHEAVSKVLMSSTPVPFSEEINHTSSSSNAVQESGLSRLFGTLNNCTIGSVTINMNPTINSVEEEFNRLVMDSDCF